MSVPHVRKVIKEFELGIGDFLHAVKRVYRSYQLLLLIIFYLTCNEAHGVRQLDSKVPSIKSP